MVEDTLAARGIAVAIAGDTLVDFVVRNMGIQHSFDAGFEAELSVVDLSAGLDEPGHAHAENIGWSGVADHDGDCLCVIDGLS